MTGHDPLCPNATLHMDYGEPQRVVINCQCALIALVRADELDRWLKSDHLEQRIAQEIEAQPIDAWGSQAPRGPVSFARAEAFLAPPALPEESPMPEEECGCRIVWEEPNGWTLWECCPDHRDENRGGESDGA